MNNLEFWILFGIFTLVTYVLCQYFYNKGFDDGSITTSRAIATATLEKKVSDGKKKK